MIQTAKRYRLLNNLITALTGIFLLTSCEEKIDWEQDTISINTVVVEGIITNENKHHHIRLTKPFLDQNSLATPVSDAYVVVRSGNDQAVFIESDEFPGYYISEIPFAATVERTYELEIVSEGKQYSAVTQMVPVLPSTTPQWIFNPDNNLYSIGWPSGNYSILQQAMYEAEIYWSHLTTNNLSDTLTSAKLLYYSLNTIDVSFVIFPQDREKVYFPKNSIAIVRKYSLTDEYASYIRALLAETEWQGSLFEDARGNLPTNITNGGFGYFSACTVLADTVVVN